MKFVGRYSRFEEKKPARAEARQAPTSVPASVVAPAPFAPPRASAGQPELVFSANSSVGYWWEYECTDPRIVQVVPVVEETSEETSSYGPPCGLPQDLRYRLVGQRKGRAEITFKKSFRHEAPVPVITYKVTVDEGRHVTIMETYAPY